MDSWAWGSDGAHFMIPLFIPFHCASFVHPRSSSHCPPLQHPLYFFTCSTLFEFFPSCHQSAVITIQTNGTSFSSIPLSVVARFPGGERQWLLCVWNTLQHDTLRQRVVLRQDPQQGLGQIPGQEVQQDRAVHCVSVIYTSQSQYISFFFINLDSEMFYKCTRTMPLYPELILTMLSSSALG